MAGSRAGQQQNDEAASPTSQSSSGSAFAEPRESAIPILPRTSMSSPTIQPAVPATAQVPLSPRRLKPISIAPQTSGGSAPSQRVRSPATSPRRANEESTSPVFLSSDDDDGGALPPAKPTQSPLPPIRPARPGETRKLYNPGWSHPFPSSQLEPTPPRPPRPARPSEALMFVSPTTGEVSVPRTPEQQDAFDNERVDMNEYLETTEPPPPAAHPSSSPETQSSPELAPFGSSRGAPRKNSVQRKPVPQYIPSPVQRSGTPGRLSIGGFEALLKDSATESPEGLLGHDKIKSRLQHLYDPNDAGDREPFSPRLGLGLPEAGVTAREQRLAREQADLKNRASRTGGDIGEENLVSWSERLMQSDWFPSTLSKRLSLLPGSGSPMASKRASAFGNDEHAWKADGPSTAAYVHAHSASRNPSAKGFSPLPLHNTPQAGNNGRRGANTNSNRNNASRRTRSGPEFASPITNRSEKSLGEVVVLPSVWEDDGQDDDDIRRDPSFRPERMYYDSIEYRSVFARIVHALYPFFVIAHIPATLFLDFNVIYTLAQLAIYPTLPSTSVLLRRDIVNVPTLNSSTAYYVALGVYAGCTFLWLVVVVLWLDFIRCFVRPWSTAGRVPIGQVYRSAAGFNYACMSKYERFCIMWRVRLAPFNKSGKIGRMIKGNSFWDGIAESCSWYAQNWPTVVLLVPRAGLSLALLLLFGTTAYGSADIGPTDRDNAFFRSNGTLTNFAQGVLLTNCVWAALRLLIVVIAAVGLFFFRKPFSRSPEPFSSYYHPSREQLTKPTSPEIADQLDEKAHVQARRNSLPGWILRRDRRLRAAILLCLRPSAHSSPAYSPFFKTGLGTGKSSTEEWRTIDLDSKRRSSEATRREEQRRAELANRGANWTYFTEGDSPDAPKLDRKWSALSPQPKLVTSRRSPMTAASASEYQMTPALASSGLHRRVRSVPIQSGENLMIGETAHTDDEDAGHDAERVQVRFDVPKSSLGPYTNDDGGIRPLSLHLDNIDLMDEEILRPQLRSHFSYMSELTGTSNIATPTNDVSPVMRSGSFDAAAAGLHEHDVRTTRDGAPLVYVQKPSPSSSLNEMPKLSSGGVGAQSGVTSPALTEERPGSMLTLGDTPSIADIRYARTLEVAKGVISRRRLSEQLLQEIKRLGEAEEAVRQEERRLAALRRVSEQAEQSNRDSLQAASTTQRHVSYNTARSEQSKSDLGQGTRDSHWSSRTGVGEHFASARSSFASMAHGSPPTSAQNATASSGVAPGLLLPPFKVSQVGDEQPTYELSSPTLNNEGFAPTHATEVVDNDGDEGSDIGSARLSPSGNSPVIAPSTGGVEESTTAAFLDEDDHSSQSSDDQDDEDDDDTAREHTGPQSVGNTPQTTSRSTFDPVTTQASGSNSPPRSNLTRPKPLLDTPTHAVALVSQSKPMSSPSANTFGGKKSRESRMPASPSGVASVVKQGSSSTEPQEFPFE
ncbi:hypothetical protein OIO90_003255 [Microbotryomycetes sp. JL221]|nr:hypothetical protein OIO90_003255 [Microbotryomycetes sp. JL221]